MQTACVQTHATCYRLHSTSHSCAQCEWAAIAMTRDIVSGNCVCMQLQALWASTNGTGKCRQCVWEARLGPTAANIWKPTWNYTFRRVVARVVVRVVVAEIKKISIFSFLPTTTRATTRARSVCFHTPWALMPAGPQAGRTWPRSSMDTTLSLTTKWE